MHNTPSWQAISWNVHQTLKHTNKLLDHLTFVLYDPHIRTMHGWMYFLIHYVEFDNKGKLFGRVFFTTMYISCFWYKNCIFLATKVETFNVPARNLPQRLLVSFPFHLQGCGQGQCFKGSSIIVYERKVPSNILQSLWAR